MGCRSAYDYVRERRMLKVLCTQNTRFYFLAFCRAVTWPQARMIADGDSMTTRCAFSILFSIDLEQLEIV